MFTGFNLTFNDTFKESFINNYKKEGETLNDKFTKETKDNLRSFLNSNDELDGSKLIDSWFPNLNCQVFISHSHNDIDLAISLAGWLKKNFNLNAFVDYCVWGNCNDLLKEIDDIYCLNSSENSYDYQKRNFSTSHVHMMLSTALTEMINTTECIFFLNTKNSLSSNIKSIMQNIGNTTSSPWIYSELKTIQLIQKNPISNERLSKIFETQKYFHGTPLNESFNQKDLSIKYNIQLDNLIPLSYDDLIKWKDSKQDAAYCALDNLYKLKKYEILSKIKL